MIAFPGLTALVLAVLTLAVFGQWRSRRKPHQLAWTTALAFGLLGTLAYVGVVQTGGNPWLFRIYYLGGAVLIAPLLGVGSAYLLPDPRWARLLLGITVACALVAGVGLAALPLDRGALANLDLGPGAGVVTAAPVIASVIIANTLGTIAVVGVALRSLLAAVFRARPWTLVWGNGLIAAGTLIIAAAGSLARLGHGVGFWGTMTIGWIVLYGGFALLAAGTAPATRPVAA